MDKDTKVKLVKMLVRIGTFITVSNATLYALDQIVPNNKLTTAGKVVLLIAEALVAEGVGSEAAKVIDGLMDGTLMGTVIFGKEEVY